MVKRRIKIKFLPKGFPRRLGLKMGREAKRAKIVQIMVVASMSR
jgi:hypothetical protein